jgi:hypothetical protein
MVSMDEIVQFIKENKRDILIGLGIGAVLGVTVIGGIYYLTTSGGLVAIGSQSITAEGLKNWGIFILSGKAVQMLSLSK